MPVKLLQPGDYTKNQLQDALDISPATVERYRERFKIPDKEGPGRAKLLVIDDAIATAINEYLATWKDDLIPPPETEEPYQKTFTPVTEPSPPDVAQSLSLSLSEQVQELFQENRELLSKLHTIEKEKIKLEGQLSETERVSAIRQETQDSLLQSKLSEINTLQKALETNQEAVKSLKASMVLLEDDNRRLHQTINQLENTLKPPLHYLPADTVQTPISENKADKDKKPFWKRLFPFG